VHVLFSLILFSRLISSNPICCICPYDLVILKCGLDFFIDWNMVLSCHIPFHNFVHMWLGGHQMPRAHSWISFLFCFLFLISLCCLLATKRPPNSHLDTFMLFGISYLTKKIINILSTWINYFNLDNTLSFHESFIFFTNKFCCCFCKCAFGPCSNDQM
jgi:hypothetical protein